MDRVRSLSPGDGREPDVSRVLHRDVRQTRIGPPVAPWTGGQATGRFSHEPHAGQRVIWPPSARHL